MAATVPRRNKNALLGILAIADTRVLLASGSWPTCGSYTKTPSGGTAFTARTLRMPLR